MAQLLTAGTNLAAGIEDPVHCADRAVIDALVEQGGVDFGRGQISKAGRSEEVEDDLTRFCRERPRRAGARYQRWLAKFGHRYKWYSLPERGTFGVDQERE